MIRLYTPAVGPAILQGTTEEIRSLAAACVQALPRGEAMVVLPENGRNQLMVVAVGRPAPPETAHVAAAP